MIPTVILHGWSDTASSFKGLAEWLKNNHNIEAVDIFLGDYLSMNDEITLFDLGYAFQLALDKVGIPQKRHSFNLIVHSTGGLVAREYLRQKCLNTRTGKRDAALTPIRNLCMLAPANFGSPLATLGKSILGRIAKGWRWDGFGESGQKILDALELASPYTFELAQDDLFDSSFPVFDPKNTRATVMVGTRAYPDAMRSTMHEAGGDGTVRVATASLQASLIQVDFFSEKDDPAFIEVGSNCRDIALAVFDRDHSGITQPDNETQKNEWVQAMVSSLTCTERSYDRHFALCERISGETFQRRATSKDYSWYHEYQHVVFRVRDQHGAPIDDFMIEFYQEPRDKKEKVFKFINTEIIEKVTKNQRASNMRSFFFDITDLQAYLSKNQSASVDMSISAAHVSKRIRYRNPKKGIRIFGGNTPGLMRPNRPVLVDITLHRDPEVNSKDKSANVFSVYRT